MSPHARVLVIAASDSSGGAGLTRDAQTLGELGVAMCCAVTAVTVQTDDEVRALYPVPPQIVGAQIRAALDSGSVAAIKIGVLAAAATVQAVAECLPPRERVPIVLDPVLVSSSGGMLLDPAGLQLLRALLLPRVSLLTPNIAEATALLGEPLADDDGIEQVALSAQLQRLLALGPAAVLIKGGHRGGERDRDVIDTLAVPGREPVRITAPRVPAQQRGTGCSLASAIAARLADGGSLLDACSSAQRYVVEALRRSAELRPARWA